MHCYEIFEWLNDQMKECCGTCHKSIRTEYIKNPYNSPRIQNGYSVITVCMQNAHQVCKHRLPYTKLKLVHEIRNEHLIKVESVFEESKRKHILEYLSQGHCQSGS